MAQALCGRGSLLWDQLQHGDQEVGEAFGFFAGPLVLVYQHLKQTPGLQLGNVLQITCRQSDGGVSESHAGTKHYLWWKFYTRWLSL